MLGVSGLMGSSGDGAAAAAADAHESGGASGGSSDVGASSSVPGGGLEESGGGGGGGGGNRWPRQETLALLKIRSEMDVTFRDSSLKGPLWEEVSRKMAEQGFQRSAKKCKEKFENVYKYHKRTKDGRASKSDGVGGKTYRFFDQLEALENTPPPSFTPPPPPRPPPPLPPTVAATLPAMTLPITVSSSSPNPVSVFSPTQTANINFPINSSPSSFQFSGQPLLQQPPPLPMNPPQPHANFQVVSHIPPSRMSDTTSNSSTSSDEDIQRRRGKKRKWKDFFQRLMKDVINKQEELQRKFLDTLEKRERDRMAREEAWRVQETARMNREHELLVQERSIAAAKDAAVVAFLRKVTEQHNFQLPIGANNNNITPPQSQAPPPPPPVQVLVQPPQNPQPPPPRPPPQNPQPITPPPKPISAPPLATPTKTSDTSKTDNGSGGGGGGGGDNSMSASSSRWPKAEVEALIKLRTNLDLKYQENGPKGPLWEEISAAMAKIGYNRSSKRCKEKWENINKYFKKVKESNKKRPEDSKTCPYFHQLDAIYRERAKPDAAGYAAAMNNPDNPMAAAPPIMARPENQWPLPDHQQQPQHDAAMADQYQDNESDHDDDEDDEEEDDDAQGYEVVTNKQPSSVS